MEKTTRSPGGHGATPHAPRSGGLLGSRPEPYLLDLDYYGIIRRGSARPNNEDALLLAAGVDRTLFAVADGIGGRSSGEVASAMAVEALEDLGPEDPLEAAIQQAHSEILAAQCEERLAGMGTTLVAVRFFGLAAEVAHLGDSRAYLVRDGFLRPLTEDHSLVNELLRSGVITPAQTATHPWRKILTRALGASRGPRVENKSFDVVPGDRVVLCSDGLSDVVPEAGLVGLLEEHPRDPEGAARGLAAAAREAGSPDDVTVVVVDAKGPRRTFARFVGAERGHPACFPAEGCPGAGRPGRGGDGAVLPRGRALLRRAQPEGGAPRSPQVALGLGGTDVGRLPAIAGSGGARLPARGRASLLAPVPRGGGPRLNGLVPPPRPPGQPLVVQAAYAGRRAPGGARTKTRPSRVRSTASVDDREAAKKNASTRLQPDALNGFLDAGDILVPQSPGLGRARGGTPKGKE